VAKRNLLLVDADPRSLRVLEVSLRKAGYSVSTCGDVDGALELIGLSEPDMVISDTRLPGKDGLSLVRELRSRSETAKLPVMFLSSDPSVETKVKSLELGIEDYLTKPLYMREILTRVNLIMERSDRDGLGRAAKTRFSGSLEDMGLVDLLQTIELSRKSGVLKLSYGQRRGSMSFSEGRIIDAELGGLHGEAAIYRFLLWSEGAFELEFREVRGEDKLGISTQALLMEGVRRLDEWGRLQEQLPGLHAVLEVNHAELSLRLGEVADELNVVLRAFDGQRDLIQVLEASGGDDLTTLTAISKLFFDGFLMVRHRTDPSEARVGANSDPFLGYVPTESSPPNDAAASVSLGFAPTTTTSGSPSLGMESSRDGSLRAAQSLRGNGTDPPGTPASRVPLAVLQLKRVSAINENLLRPHVMTKEVGPDGGLRGDGERYESLRPAQAAEGEDDMAKRGKRKDRLDERTGGTVIPLHAARGDSTPSTEVHSSQVVSTGSGGGSAATPSSDEAQGEQVAHEDDHPDVEHFFSTAGRGSTPHVSDNWGDDLDTGDHEPDAVHHGRRKGMVWTGAIAGGGLLLISAFLVYNKLLMPAPEELGSGPVMLPTPDMMQGTRGVEPEPARPPSAAKSELPLAATSSAEPAPSAQPSEQPSSQPSAQPTEPSAQQGVEPPLPAATQTTSAPTPVIMQPVPPPAAGAPAPAGTYEVQLAEARKLGLRKNAEQAFLKALEARPAGAEALSGLAMLYLNQGKNQQARERAQQALAIDAQLTEGWIVLGAAQDALGNRTGARDAYSKCAALPADKYVLECRRMLH